jgi:uncharacterized protein (UPF0212 family)
MHALSASDLLSVWERGFGAGLIRRALELLSAACPEADPEELAALSIGQRDTLLLRLRQWTFGSPLTGMAACPRCGEQIELTFDPADLPALEAVAQTTIAMDSYELSMRPPSSRDVAAASDPDLDRARLQLFESCLLSATRGGSAVSPSELPADVVREAERRLADADPVSEIQLAVACPACGSQRTMTFDIVSFFWAEIDAWARRIFREVHTLAVVHGWSEREILALSPLRRQCYLDLVGT